MAKRFSVSSVRLRSATTAASSNAITVLTPMNACRISRDTLAEPVAKGPTPWRVPWMEIPDNRKTAVAAARAPKRKATQIRKGMQRNSRGRCLLLAGKKPPNTNSPTEKRLRTPAAASNRAPLHSHRDLALQRTSSGVTTRAPPASPSHQVTQIGTYLAHDAKPVRDRLVTPIVALTVVLAMPARTANLRTSWAFSNAFRP